MDNNSLDSLPKIPTGEKILTPTQVNPIFKKEIADKWVDAVNPQQFIHIETPDYSYLQKENPIVTQLKEQNKLQSEQIQELTKTVKNLQDSKPKKIFKLLSSGIWFVIGVAITYYFPTIVSLLKNIFK